MGSHPLTVKNKTHSWFMVHTHSWLTIHASLSSLLTCCACSLAAASARCHCSLFLLSNSCFSSMKIGTMIWIRFFTTWVTTLPLATRILRPCQLPRPSQNSLTRCWGGCTSPSLTRCWGGCASPCKPVSIEILKYNPSTSIIITEQAIYRKQLPRSQHITWPTWLKGALVPFVSAKRHKCAFIFIPIVRQYQELQKGQIFCLNFPETESCYRHHVQCNCLEHI